MSKRPLHVLTLVSAIVCAGSLGLVGRSLFLADFVLFSIGQSNWFEAHTIDGHLVLRHGRSATTFLYFSANASRTRHFDREISRELDGIRWLGISWGKRSWILPLWLVPLLTAILPVRWWRARRRGRGSGFDVAQAPAAT